MKLLYQSRIILKNINHEQTISPRSNHPSILLSKECTIEAETRDGDTITFHFISSSQNFMDKLITAVEQGKELVVTLGIEE